MAISLMMLGGAKALPEALPSTGEVDVRFEGLRSAKGVLRACMTRNPRYFPDCDKDPAALHASTGAAAGSRLRFADVKPGDYALLVLHDENDNARLDKMLGIPREGVGFSRNPRLGMGPPAFEKVRFGVQHDAVEQTVQLKYFL